MKRTQVLIVIMIIYLTGCQASDLEAYKEAFVNTEAYTSGVATSSLTIDLEFDETGLTFEEIRDLSYFERIEMVTSSKYKNRGNVEKAIIDSYFNFGGLGFDMVYYIEGKKILIKLPIMDKYIKVHTDEVVQKNKIKEDSQDKAFRKIMDAWNSVLKEEDVVSGSKAYVLTDKGQIKTTTYSIEINESQFEVLKKEVLRIIEDEKVVQSFAKELDGFVREKGSGEEIREALQKAIGELTLKQMEGRGYVDFDGRLIKQVFTAELFNPYAASGSIEEVRITYENSFDQLGAVHEVVIPDSDDVEMLDIEDGNTLEDYFPEGLF